MTAQHSQTERIALSGWRLTLARGAWWVILFLTLGTWLGAFTNDFSYHLSLNLTAAQAQLLHNMGLTWRSVVLYISSLKVLGMALYLFIAVLIFWRRPRELHTILISATLILTGSVSSWVFPTLDPSQPVLYRLSILVLTLGWFAFGVLFFVFPDGRVVPKWGRWFAGLYLIYILISNFLPESPFRSDTTTIREWLSIAVFFVSGISAQTYRYFRVSNQIQRQQTKWVLYAFLLSSFLLLFIDFIPIFVPGLSNPNTTLGAFYALFIYDLQYRIIYLLLPLAIGVAILQYRLFNIDVIIRRTLVYSILTVLLGLIYFGGVAIVQNLFTALTGQESAIAVVVSTLFIAALFTPIRTRVQNFIDKRFYRRKYNAERSLARFTTLARYEVEIEPLAGELLDVVQETMQPEQVSLWLVTND